jgi:hypothetical protein
MGEGRVGMLSETARTILGLIAEGRSYDQILQQHLQLTYFDIFGAAREALDLAQTALPKPPPEEIPLPLHEIPPPEASALPDESAPPEESVLPALPPRRVSFVERARATHGRAFARWSRDEDARLEGLFREGTPRAEIARQLDRHDGAISRRLEKLGLISEPEQVLSRARRDGQPTAPGPTEMPGGDELPSGRPTVPGWDLFRDRLNEESGST